ncbi:hypothetical protein SAMN05216205_4879 [Pseudomonas mohnii]|uniref:Morphogenetic protein n=1 Tax=Pseudomonas mohnii TaxID=395600 RepID=A0ABY0YC18_9PSED|nr:hypothetical protein [Pseudomonas mohnii]SED31249.1 hypothetical protein SAMN05216205_4879 [Pseudomonas mohnii]
MSEIKERPILFSAPMVRAILEGRKSVTRRALNERALKNIGYGVQLGECHELPTEGPLHPNSVGYYNDFCPFGQPGDRLYVRETFNRTNPGGAEGVYYYRADGEFPKCIGGGKFTDVESWKPSIHMPRTASRILLEITAVRVERLQDITPEQVTAEGVSTRGEAMWGSRWWVDAPEQTIEDARKDFADLWTSTGGDWDANPWVWVVEFKRVTP